MLFQYIPSQWAEIITAQVSSFLFNFFGLTSNYGIEKGLVYLTLFVDSNNIKVNIIRECSALHVIGLLIGLIAPISANYLDKVKAIILGILLVFVMNISRILLTVYLTGVDIPPFSWFLSNPTVETYHYPISFIYGVFGIAVTILIITHYILPELGEFLYNIPETLLKIIKNVDL
jgi:exosortase/archaeosortase family protein